MYLLTVSQSVMLQQFSISNCIPSSTGSRPHEAEDPDLFLMMLLSPASVPPGPATEMNLLRTIRGRRRILWRMMERTMTMIVITPEIMERLITRMSLLLSQMDVVEEVMMATGDNR